MTRHLAVLSAGLRSPSSTRLLADQLGERAGAHLRATLGPVEDVVVHAVEVRELAHEIADALLTGFPSGALREAVDTVTSADGLVVVTPTFSASYAGLFKSFVDVLEPQALVDMPVLLAATGGSERHSLMIEHALRPLFTYLKAVPVPTGVYAATADFGGPGSTALAERVDRAGAELARAVAVAGPRSTVPEFTEFADLLRG